MDDRAGRHALGFRGGPTALTPGAGATFAVLYLLEGWEPTRKEPGITVYVAAVDGVVALIIWRIAYRQPFLPRSWRRG